MADKKTEHLVDDNLKHIAFIMDGNGRWAEKRGMPRRFGHSYGAKKFREIINYCGDIGIKYVTVYAFSTENWGRPKKEIDSIMKLLDEYLDECEVSLEKYDIRLRFIGDLSPMSDAFRARAADIEKRSASNNLYLNVALNYGGRDELVHAFNRLIADGKSSVSESDITHALYTDGIPDPDMIVRTAGEERLSNFLTWQSVYSELYFTDVLWPDMTPHDVDMAVEEFYRRKRRYGKV